MCAPIRDLLIFLFDVGTSQPFLQQGTVILLRLTTFVSHYTVVLQLILQLLPLYFYKN